ncbi:ester cyclase [Pelagicoccus sp. NFK12]|uniref:Ester cyclase n=1 Tax=Pelagicoccus enzymogenes TaxID=2773457 RepID=A0A927IJY4_9BACT|nr:ester cyclase [Pelagicoccus enzymogenes]MBD5782040.1 ester cyclase [Pelagicoccus enzymogenes]
MKEQNKQTVRIFIEEALNRGNLRVIDEVIHASYRYDSPNEAMQGVEQLKAFVLALRSAFPDLYIAIEEQIAEGQSVCTRISLSGSHQGPFLGVPATGKSVQLQGVIISRFEGPLILHEWELLDQLGLLQQLGLVKQ